jgi:hypothetical protein
MTSGKLGSTPQPIDIVSAPTEVIIVLLDSRSAA